MQNPIDSFFEKIYVINLEEDKDRKNSIIEQFKKYNIQNYTIFQATDKNKINLEEFINNKLWAYPGNNF